MYTSSEVPRDQFLDCFTDLAKLIYVVLKKCLQKHYSLGLTLEALEL